MGGGLFGTPLYLNIKCIIFGFVLVSVYWLPHPKYIQHQYITSFLLVMAGYVMLAWYDYLYDCTDKMGPTFFGALLGWAKPYGGVPPGTDPLPSKYKKIVGVFDFFVLLIIVAAFVYPFMYK
jgi:UDP-N-acetylmuramyl pentapeptide phosphotransferase/UDP-N-acetylglucosamine-1-phosphate transferase